MSSTGRSRLTHASARTFTVLGLSCAAGLIGGCGRHVTVPSFTTPVVPAGFQKLRYAPDGVALSVPRNWTVTPEKSPMVAAFSSGPAVISLWRYPSSHGALNAAQLPGALNALVAAAKTEDPTLQVERTGLSRVGAAGAVIIDGLEQVNGKPRRVRSEHVYVDGAELVLDAYAPVADFASVDHNVFSPVRKSLALLNGGTPTTTTTATTGSPP